jgi:Arc/MetJ-type ribon-helix-helix transcriptional regulator
VNIILDIPEDLQTHIKAQIQAGIYSSAVEYFLELGQQDRQRRSNQNKIEQLLQSSLDSDLKPVNSEYWKKLHASIFDVEYH